MNTPYIFWSVAILCLVATLFLWRGSLTSFIGGIFSKEEPVDNWAEDLKIEIPEEAINPMSEEDGQTGQVLGEQTETLSDLDRINCQVKTISRQTQVLESEIEDMQTLEDIESQLEQIELQIEQLSLT